jgi:signal transduction histidine kinase
MRPPRERKPVHFLRFLVGILLALALALALFYWLMQPPLNEFGFMTLLMGVTALVSTLVAYLAYRLGWINRSLNLRWALMAGYGLAGLLVFFNVWLIARMMFASRHDLLLATVLLVFATSMAMLVGFFLSEAVTDRLSALSQAARQISLGRLETRVPVHGKDEVASLAATFNEMAARLEETEQQKKELETLRRDLIAWVGHDLRTPLTSIRAILEALADGLVEDPPTVQRYLQTAQRDIRSLSTLIDDLFEMAQMDAGGLQLDCQPNSITDLVSDTIESFTELASRQGIRLSGEADPDLDPVVMDAPRIGRVLANLVSNALRHTPPGGSVTIHARREEQTVRVTVCDTGSGINPQDLSHVFDRFYRGEKSRNRSTGGSGLGLAISKGIVEAHGGQIGVESQPGKGAEFSFTLKVKGQ